MFGSVALPVQPSFYFVAQAGPWTSTALAPVSKVLSLQTQTIILGFLANLKTRFYFYSFFVGRGLITVQSWLAYKSEIRPHLPPECWIKGVLHHARLGAIMCKN